MGVLSPALAVRNMKETVKFYKNSLGFKLEIASPDANNPQYAELSKDGIVLMFILAKSCNIGDEEKLGIGVTLYMQIDGDIDEYYLELKKRGVKITVGIADEPYGIRDFATWLWKMRTQPGKYLRRSLPQRDTSIKKQERS